MNNDEYFLEAAGITKNFVIGKHRIEVLKGVGLQVKRGEWVALLGASGSGKTTLLDIIGTISRPDSGTLTADGRAQSGMILSLAKSPPPITLPALAVEIAGYSPSLKKEDL